MKRAVPDIVTELQHTGKRLRVPVRTVGMQPGIKKILEEILRRYGCRDLLNPVFTCVMELLNNALKANYKSIYFENYKPKNRAALDYPTALQLFKLEVSRKEHILQKMALEKHMAADVIFSLQDSSLHLSVINPFKMTDAEHRNVLEKFETAQHCPSLTEYFLRNEHDPFREGAGLGLVLVVMILKSLGLESSNITVRPENNATIATMVIPLNDATVQSYLKIASRACKGLPSS